jgi:hypothetical protein
LISGFAAAQVNGQATIEGGYASTWIVPPGAYAVPLVPLITTPIYDFPTPPLEVGASNATIGTVAGATNSAPAFVVPSSYPLIAPLLAPGLAFSSPTSEGNSATADSRKRSFDLGVAKFESDYGVAELVAKSRPRAHAAKTYTNDDVNRLNQNTGEVKFKGKIERLN